MTRKRLLLVLLAVSATLILHAQQTPVPQRPAGSVEALIVAAAELRANIDKGYLAAFRACGGVRVEEQVQRLDEFAWNGINPQLGWSFLIGTSPMMIGAADGPRPLMGFYHPWSDVLLLLAWDRTGQELQLQDVALLDAEILRYPDAPAPGPYPGWAAAEEFAPLAIARGMAELTDAFERLYPPEFANDWRDPLAAWSEPAYRELNAAAVDLRLTRAMVMFGALRLDAEQQSPEIAALTAAAEEFRSGDLEALLGQARYTLPETQEVLRQAPAGALSVLTAVSAIPAKPAGLIFLAPPDSPDYFVSLLLTDEGSQHRLERIDLVHYASVAEAFQGQEAQ